MRSKNMTRGTYQFAVVVAVCIVPLFGCSCKPQGMANDPWSDTRGTQTPKQLSRLEAKGQVPFELVQGPGDELSVEMLNIDYVSTRVTYRLSDGTLYRVVQYPSGTSPYKSDMEPTLRYDFRSIHSRDISEGLAPNSAVWWDDKQLGEVEVGSDELGVSRLLEIAKTIIDNASHAQKT